MGEDTTEPASTAKARSEISQIRVLYHLFEEWTREKIACRFAGLAMYAGERRTNRRASLVSGAPYGASGEAKTVSL